MRTIKNILILTALMPLVLFAQFNGGIGRGDVCVSVELLSQPPAPTINTIMTDDAFCAGQGIIVSYSTTGNFDTGNDFIIQLSDVNGSFASPTVIGTISSSASAGQVNAVIPQGTATGTGYRIRVVSTSPAAIGSDNGYNIEVYAIDLAISSNLTSLCPGDVAIISANNAYTSYTWSNLETTPSISVSQVGTYSLTVADANGCIGESNTIELTPGDFPIAGFTHSQDDGYIVNFENTSINGVTFEWTFIPGNTSTQENPQFTYPFDGFYNVTLIVSNGCGSDTINTTIEVFKLSVHNLEGMAGFNVYPNPVENIIFIEGKKEGMESTLISIFDAQGRLTYQEQFQSMNNNIKTIDFSMYSCGIYFISLQNSKGRLTGRIVKQ
jgi:hypothetical protein